MIVRHCNILAAAVLAVAASSAVFAADRDMLTLRTRAREADAKRPDLFHVVHDEAEWNAKKTAIVICDMWDKHWCEGATRRVVEMVPRMNEVLDAARAKGILIIHCPSACMEAYAGTPQRKLAQEAPKIPTKPLKPGWCARNGEKEPPLPILNPHDRCDCPVQCPHGNPWRRQVAGLKILEGDAITDSIEAYYLMRARGIDNVIVMGVHTNMCVLGRPFAIRQMVSQGQNVVLMRDLTDVNRDSQMPPAGIDHFRGTDLVLEHIEKFWCPTIASSDFVATPAHRFAADARPHVVFIVGEDEYETHRTLPDFAAAQLDSRGVRSTFVMASKREPNDFAGLETLETADLMVVSVRRRLPAMSQLERIRSYCERGKPVIGLRTASHAFAPPAGTTAAEGRGVWREFDRDVLGGNYTGHYGNKGEKDPSTFVRVADKADHPILAGVPSDEFGVRSWLYKTSPLASSATLLMTGRVEGTKETQPVAWTHTYRGGKVFYTSLGHEEDFALPAFRRMLTNAVFWALGRSQNESRK